MWWSWVVLPRNARAIDWTNNNMYFITPITHGCTSARIQSGYDLRLWLGSNPFIFLCIRGALLRSIARFFWTVPIVTIDPTSGPRANYGSAGSSDQVVRVEVCHGNTERILQPVLDVIEGRIEMRRRLPSSHASTAT
jgi:hypothetical protein